MSPESCRGDGYSASSDIYSLGCALYECAIGELPFRGETVTEIMYRHIRDPIPELEMSQSSSPLERKLAEIIVRCLQKCPADRYQTASEVRAELFSLPSFAQL
jgi:serine/threonine protein kinase